MPRLEHEKLAHEAAGERNARKQPRNSVIAPARNRFVLPKPRQAAQRRRLAQNAAVGALLTNQGHDGEGSDRRQAVGEQIEGSRADAVPGVRPDADEHSENPAWAIESERACV